LVLGSMSVARGRWFSGPDARTGGAAPVTGVGLVLGSWLLVRGPWNRRPVPAVVPVVL